MNLKEDDNGGYFPTRESAKAYIDGKAGSNTSLEYHADRMRALNNLIVSMDLPEQARILDFGCGDAMYIREFFAPSNVSLVAGVDISGPMIDLASENLKDFGFEGYVGGLDALKSVQGQFDVVFAIDVLGYFEEPELDDFYQEVAKLVCPGGYLIIMYGNELFDMFALNAGTSVFYQKHFDIDVTDLLTESRSNQHRPANRKNPMNFGAQIAPYGFEEVKQAYSQWHVVPPAIGNKQGGVTDTRMKMRNHAYDPNTLPPSELWKAAFRCSIFASLSQKI